VIPEDQVKRVTNRVDPRGGVGNRGLNAIQAIENLAVLVPHHHGGSRGGGVAGFLLELGKENLLLEADVASQAIGEGGVDRGRFGEAALGPRLEGGAFEGVEAIVIPGQALR
jgi:hypothetical protein